jgi:tRNA pseudouridine55 synthase
MSRRSADDPALHGVLLVDKPAGPTSHDVVGWVRWVLGVRRVGHAGTLDPAATGLLVVGVGAATKLAPYLTGEHKRYRARFVLGASTTTADAEGTVVEALACPADLEARVPAALAALAEVRALPPPAYSAIHVDGQRAHELARAGRPPVLDERPMTVLELRPGLVRRRGDRVEVEAELLVSKGTYVRSLAEALGRSLGVPAHLGALHRTHSGALGLDHPRALTGLVAEQIRLEPRADGATAPLRWRLRLPACATPPEAAAVLRARLLPPSTVVPMPVLHATGDPCGRRALARLAAGQTLALPDPGLQPATPSSSPSSSEGERVAVASADDGALVVARLDPGGVRLRPERVVVPPAAHP